MTTSTEPPATAAREVPPAADGALGEAPVEITAGGGPRRVRRTRRTRRRRLWKRSILTILLVVVLAVGWSLGHALLRDTNDPVGTKFVEWVRDHGGGGLVNQIETWWYSNHQPPKGGTPKGGIPKVAAPTVGKRPVARPAPAVDPRDLPPAPVPTVTSHPLFAEGAWRPTGKLVGGVPAVYQTFVRPDDVHTSLLAGLIWMNQHRLSARMYNGIDVPGGSGWHYGSRVDPADDASLVAAFNGGFRLDASRGGYLAEGRTVRPLVPGRASFVIHTDGTATVGAWGRDVNPGPDIASVRQNLDLIVDGGQPVPGLEVGDNYRWGATLGGKVFVWRSGVGIDARGNLIYVAGELDIVSLADVLARAGAVRAMELDINSGWVSAYVYSGTGPTDTQGVKLLGAIQRPANRYLVPGSRDFIALFARP